MKRWKLVLLVTSLIVATIVLASAALAAMPGGDLAALCESLYGGVFEIPNSEPLGPCQWDMALINASDDGSYAIATGDGVTVGVIDSGLDVASVPIQDVLWQVLLLDDAGSVQASSAVGPVTVGSVGYDLVLVESGVAIDVPASGA